jgi:hypothetical protein
MNQGGHQVANVLAGIGTIIIVGMVVANGANVAQIINSLGRLYSNAALAAQGKGQVVNA